MDISSYQRQARATNQIQQTPDYDSVIVPLLGIAGEIGTLQAAYKKKLRDGDQYDRFPSDVAEELGDIIWYVSNLADHFDLDLSVVLEQNLQKTQARWPPDKSVSRSEDDFFDTSAPAEERLPRTFTVEFRAIDNPNSREPKVTGILEQQAMGR